MSKGKEGPTEYWLVLITDTLKQLDTGLRAAFLQKFLRTFVGREISEKESISHWEGILARQSHMAEKLGRAVRLRTAAVDYFGELNILKNPVVLEYEELTELRYNAATDPLTGLNNRRMFEEYLEQEIGRSTRYKSPFALLSFDLRTFKSVNDLYGHAVGDAVLRAAARASLDAVRAYDVPCRTGGDEFAILLPQSERLGTQVLAERIARKFEEYARPLAPGVPVGIDYGIAIFPEDGFDALTLCTAADRRLYAGKNKRLAAPSESAGQASVAAIQNEAPATPAEREAPVRDAQPVVYVPGLAGPIVTPGDVRAADIRMENRRFERIRLNGPRALGIVQAGGKNSAVEVLDASAGGVCLVVEQAELPETFKALLRLPMIPGDELTLLRVYTLPFTEGKHRVGCALVSASDLRVA